MHFHWNKMEDTINRGGDNLLIRVYCSTEDDNTDNRFYEKVGRFPEIEEDEAPCRLLCNEYPCAD